MCLSTFCRKIGKIEMRCWLDCPPCGLKVWVPWGGVVGIDRHAGAEGGPALLSCRGHRAHLASAEPTPTTPPSEQPTARKCVDHRSLVYQSISPPVGSSNQSDINMKALPPYLPHLFRLSTHAIEPGFPREEKSKQS